jgi:hypothetical protein
VLLAHGAAASMAPARARQCEQNEVVDRQRRADAWRQRHVSGALTQRRTRKRVPLS